MKPDAEELRLGEFRSLRNQAWALLHDDIDALKADLAHRGLGGRIADRLGEEAHEVWAQTLEVADEHRGVVAGTVVALVAWLMRGPIAHGIGALLGRDDAEPAAAPGVGEAEGERT